MFARLKPFLWALLVASFLALWGSQVVRSSCCLDESSHIPSGLYHLATGRMEAYRVNPPLPRMLAALPLLLDRPRLQWHVYDSPFRRVEYSFAEDWLTKNQSAAQRQLILARTMFLFFVAIGAWVIARWSGELYGEYASFLATSLWLLNPDVITHSAVVAPDLPASAMGLLTGYLFWKWLKSNARPFPWIVAAAVAFAILCKFTWLFLIPALLLITLIHDVIAAWRLRIPRPNAGLPSSATSVESLPCSSVISSTLKLSCSFLLTLLIINSAYGFDGSGKPLGDYSFISPILNGKDDLMRTGNRFSETQVGLLPVPLPEQMMLGLDYLKWEFSSGMSCYARGVWQDHGWWWFHLYAMAVKMPLGYWLLISIGGTCAVRDAFCGKTKKVCAWLPAIIAVFFMAVVSSQTGFTHHVRYVLPVYGFLFIIASRVVLIPAKAGAFLLICIGFAGTIAFHTTHTGLAHTHFNLAAGGPGNGWKCLGRSNVDWGQSGYRMVNWINGHPNERPLCVLFCRGVAPPTHLVNDLKGVTTTVDIDVNTGSPASGWYLLSSSQMAVQSNDFFRNMKPVAQPYPDMLLFFVDANADLEDGSNKSTGQTVGVPSD